MATIKLTDKAKALTKASAAVTRLPPPERPCLVITKATGRPRVHALLVGAAMVVSKVNVGGLLTIHASGFWARGTHDNHWSAYTSDKIGTSVFLNGAPVITNITAASARQLTHILLRLGFA